MSVCVLLSGGGARGALQLAAVEHLAPRATAWAGTSVGAVNACAAASGRVRELGAFWAAVEAAGDFQRRQWDPWRGMYSLRALRRAMEAAEALAPLAPVHVGVFDFAAGVHRLHELGPGDHPDLVWDWVCCSASIPLVHEPAPPIEGRWYGDGGLDAPLPPVPPGEWDEVHAVLCTPTAPLLRLPAGRCDGPIEQFMRGLEHAVWRSTERCLTQLERWAEDHPQTRVTVYRPQSWAVVGDTFAADRDTIQRRIEHGAWMVENAQELR
jgi:hypothetical protein